MRTKKEILQKMQDVKGIDFFGHIQSDLIEFLDFENAKPFLKDSVTEKGWSDIYKEPTDENIKAKMQDYLDFAFEKAENGKGLSAGRSMDHYYAWIWLIDAEDHFGDVRNYTDYGIGNLYMIKDYLNNKD